MSFCVFFFSLGKYIVGFYLFIYLIYGTPPLVREMNIGVARSRKATAAAARAAYTPQLERVQGETFFLKNDNINITYSMLYDYYSTLFIFKRIRAYGGKPARG